jgi:hypothetical protein
MSQLSKTWISSPLKVGQIRFPETSVQNYHATLRNTAEDLRSHVCFILHPILFPTAGVARQSHWPDFSHGSKNLRKTALKLFPSYHVRYDECTGSMHPHSWYIIFRVTILNSQQYYVLCDTLSCHAYPQMTPPYTISWRIRSVLHRKRESKPRH